MNKKIEGKLKKLARDLYWVWLDYIDSLPEEGNKPGKEDAYLSVSIFRGYVNVSSSHKEDELKLKNQIDWFEHPVRKEVKDGKKKD